MTQSTEFVKMSDIFFFCFIQTKGKVVDFQSKQKANLQSCPVKIGKMKVKTWTN